MNNLARQLENMKNEVERKQGQLQKELDERGWWKSDTFCIIHFVLFLFLFLFLVHLTFALFIQPVF